VKHLFLRFLSSHKGTKGAKKCDLFFVTFLGKSFFACFTWFAVDTALNLAVLGHV